MYPRDQIFVTKGNSNDEPRSQTVLLLPRLVRMRTIDNRKKEVSTKLWYSMIGRLATRWLSSLLGVARACAHAHIIFTAVSKRDALS